MAGPFVRSARSPRVRPPARPGRAPVARGALVGPRLIRDRAEMTEAVALLAERLVARGVAPALPQLTFATLVDNALEHGGGAVSPVAAVYLAGTFVTVSSRDGGQSVAGCGSGLGTATCRSGTAYGSVAWPGSRSRGSWRLPESFLTRRRVAQGFAATSGTLHMVL